MVTAINIKTERWNKIIAFHLSAEWKVIYKYDLFDAGVDFDLIILRRDNETILFGWDNWVEGEIKCSDKHMEALEAQFGMFEKGPPFNLKEGVVSLFWNDFTLS